MCVRAVCVLGNKHVLRNEVDAVLVDLLENSYKMHERLRLRYEQPKAQLRQYVHLRREYVYCKQKKKKKEELEENY